MHKAYRRQYGVGYIEDMLRLPDDEFTTRIHYVYAISGTIMHKVVVAACAYRFARRYPRAVRTVSDWNRLLYWIADRVAPLYIHRTIKTLKLDVPTYRDCSVIRWQDWNQNPYCNHTQLEIITRWKKWQTIRENERAWHRSVAQRDATLAATRRRLTYNHRMNNDAAFARRVRFALEHCERCDQHQPGGKGLKPVHKKIGKSAFHHQQVCRSCRDQIDALCQELEDAQAIANDAEQLRRIINRDNDQHNVENTKGARRSARQSGTR